MDKNAYSMVQELYKLLEGDKRMMTVQEHSYALGVLKTMLVLYREDAPPSVPDGARRPPQQALKKQPWYAKFI